MLHLKSALAASACALALASAAFAQTASVDIPAGELGPALDAYIRQSGVQLVYRGADVRGMRTEGVSGMLEPEAALALLLSGTGLVVMRDASGALAVGQEGADPQGGSAGGDAVEALIVTAQKREEAIQDVPIAISAFSQKALEEQKIEGGFDLMKAIPNVTFSKSNFSSYNFSIRGVGTKAVSATTDAGVAVAFNSSGLIHNRLFEQEYFDVERVEVLRGPQGTLYGRNATSGVINVISAKPDLAEFEGSIKLEAGNYDTKRVVGMLNIPLVEDVLGVRLAGARTQRSGYDYNSITQNSVNGRDLWSGRITVGFEPTDAIRADLIWEHFEEDDDRSRTGKQLCHRDPGPTVIGNTPVVEEPSREYSVKMRPATFSQGCLPGSLYADEAFGTVNGLALPFVFAILDLGADCGPGCSPTSSLGFVGQEVRTILELEDPYGGMMQSRDLRTIASVRDPIYRAKADIYELNFSLDLGDSLTVVSQTVYNEDEVYSFQDYNRFNTLPVISDSSNWVRLNFGPQALLPSLWVDYTRDGILCDPQIGCTDRVAGFDISKSQSEQFGQELRLQSDFDGPVNFSFGANYMKFETEIDYYVLNNLITALATIAPFYSMPETGLDRTVCPPGFVNTVTVPAGSPEAGCPYVDPNPIESMDGEGHNYFRSRNPYELESKAAFGEVYWNFSENVKITGGLRYTNDRKTFIPVPSQVLLAPGVVAGGTVSKGYPEKAPIIQEWGEWTGRLGVDWKPELGFTDDTLIYAFYSRGYKGGGANPPTPGFATLEDTIAFWKWQGRSQAEIDFNVASGGYPVLELSGVDYGPTFEPEFVDAYEVGLKNTLLGGAMTLNVTGFYYDYKDYQVSQIRDRSAVNENFDATVWGLEFETVFAPSRDFRINANFGYLQTRIADGERSIDIMNRTQSDPNYTLVRSWAQKPSNCVVPTHVAEAWAIANSRTAKARNLCGLGGFLGGGYSYRPLDSRFGSYYDVNNYPELNDGAGIYDDVGGNELPNAPHFTANVGVQYGRDIGSWRGTLRADAYWQSQSWARVYNAVNDKLHGWYNMNLSVWLEQPDWGVKVELYAKNLLDDTPITDAFLNSDDSGLTTNVFVLDPRLIGLSIRKEF